MNKILLPLVSAAIYLSPFAATAQSTAQASSIYGKYHLKWSSVCLSEPADANGGSQFTTTTASNGFPKVTTSSTAAAAATYFHEAYEADVVINPKLGTVATNTKKVLTFHNGVDSAGQVWDRSNRVSNQTFTVDKATDTLLFTSLNETWTTYWGASAQVTNQGGNRWRTIDNGATIESAMIDSPVISRVVFTLGSTVTTRYSMCIATGFKGTQLSKTY